MTDKRNPDYTPSMAEAIPLGLQHVLAMFVSNFTPAVIIGGAAGFAFGSSDAIFLIQMSMLFAGIATLFQTIGFGPVGARLPVMQGTSFAFIPVMMTIVKTASMGALFGSIVIAGIFHTLLGTIVGRIRNWFPPLVTGLVIVIIGLMLIPVGIEYAAGGAGDFNKGKPDWGSASHWIQALIVIVVALGVKFYSKGILSSAAILVGLIVGYVVSIPMGDVNFSGIANAAWFALPKPLSYGFEFNITAIIAMCLMCIISAIETVGDISGVTKGGAGREATDKELSGGTFADGLGTAVAGVFGGLPNTSFSQNVGLISLTGVMSRSVVTLGAIFLVICGLVPKVGAIVSSMPISVLGGGVILMFGMVISAGINMLSDVQWNGRNMFILAISLSVGLGLKMVPESLQHIGGDSLPMLLTSGLLPAALIAVVLNLILPKEEEA
ncbi:MAG TPA: nucleobase:cation symporter-2 family protein [Arenicellales bacterium]|jgi:NCS2 family nucleobase:cation symporter-2|nr:nucleobase:cation symporter-2 family protein [Arenicellales bacterium]|tara:strand:- start:172 stop:1485 length:1314 start_codon:yes stop_codon:yes gene_type:complete